MSTVEAHPDLQRFDLALSESNGVVLRSLNLEDLPAVARIHMAAFPHSALTLLGFEAVHRYYEWQLIGPHDSFASGAYIGNQLVGFTFSGVFRGATSGFLQRNRLFLIVRLLSHPWLATNPLIRERVNFSARVLRRKKSQDQTADSPAREKIPSFGILAIAVDPLIQSSGVGRLLMAEAEGTARGLGFSQMHLTVSPNNNQAIRFYERLNWEKSRKAEGWSGSMKKALGI